MRTGVMFSSKLRILGRVVLICGLVVALQFLLTIWKNSYKHTSRADSVKLKIPDRIILGQETSPYKDITTRQNQVFHRGYGEAMFPKNVQKKRRLTIGIPTIKRKDGSYFLDMLSSMFNKTAAEDLKEIVFVVFFADFDNTEWKATMEDTLKQRYSKHLKSGALITIQAPAKFYAEMPYFKDDNYTNWRTKQNYDYAFLMKYCEHLSDFYMQMEDDVEASAGYFKAVTDFIETQPHDKWICLEFSTLGFIGKLYHSNHVRKLADMILIFAHSQPVDFIFQYFNSLMLHGPRTIRKPTLFQHMGFHSSLAQKVQPLKDIFFDFPEKKHKGDNPPAKLYTTLNIHPDFPLELAYSKQPGFFWSSGAAKTDDTLTVIFDTPQTLTQVIIDTGSDQHPGDVLHNGVLEASPSILSESDGTCLNYAHLGTFEQGRLNITNMESKLGMNKIRCLRINVTQSQGEWLIVKEIAVFVIKP